MSNDHDDLRRRLRSSLDRGVAPELSAEVVSGASGRPTPHLANPARTLRIAGAAGVVLAAVTVGALVVPGLTRAPLFTAAAASDTSALGASDAISSDAKIGWWVEYHYTAGAALSTEGGSGPVYQLVLDYADPEARTADLAGALGIDGTVTKADYSDATYPTWIVGPQDGSAANLTVSAFGTGDWWFNDPSVASIYICDPSVTAADAESYGCVLPSEAPANQAPTGEAARSLAQALFASTGYTTDAAAIEVTSDTYGTSASAYLTIDGVKTALGWSAYWTNTGGLSYAYGHSVRLESRGTFNTISASDAVQRLTDYRWYGSAGPDYQGGAILYSAKAGDGVAVDPAEGSDTEPTATPDDTSAPVDPSTDVPVDPSTNIPVDPAPEPTPEVVEVTVDNATPTLLLMWDVDGNAWLVPGYAMKTPEGWWNSVVSLIDGVIALPDLM
ncbi:MAG: hypothetical protein KF761_04135 [Salinibacterium sp.]|nr:hypothetical protein [Salinibacterium sp.]